MPNPRSSRKSASAARRLTRRQAELAEESIARQKEFDPLRKRLTIGAEEALGIQRTMGERGMQTPEIKAAEERLAELQRTVIGPELDIGDPKEAPFAEEFNRLRSRLTELKAQPAPSTGAGAELFGPSGPEREVLESQFGRARENILAGGSRGGLLREQLAGADIARARGVADITGRGRERALRFASGIGFEGPSLTNAGSQLGMAGQSLAQMAGAQEAQQSQLGMGAGQLAGQAKKTLLPLLLMGCWIAAVLYGYGSREFHLARYWIFEGWQGFWADLCRSIYLKWGERAARFIQNHAWIKQYFIKPIFDIAVRKALSRLATATPPLLEAFNAPSWSKNRKAE